MARFPFLWGILLISNLHVIKSQLIDNRRKITWLVVVAKNHTSDHESDTLFGVSLINMRNDLFPTWRVVIEFKYTEGNLEGSAVQAFVEGLYSIPSSPILVGPSTSIQTEFVAALCKFYYYPQISQNTSPALSDKNKFPYYTRFGTVGTQYNFLALQLFMYYKWFDVCLLSVDSGPVYLIGVHAENLLRANNFTIMYKALYKGNATNVLLAARDANCRIFFIFADNLNIVEDYYRFECSIYDLKLFGPKYFWLTNGYPRPLDTNYMHCSWSNRLSAIEGMIEFKSPSNDFAYGWPIGISNMNITEVQNRYQIWYAAQNKTEAQKYSLDFSRFDSYWALALAINKTLQKYAWYDNVTHLGRHSFKDALLANIRATEFQGIGGYVKIDQNGDKISDIIITQIINGKAVTVAMSNVNSSQVTFLNSGLKFVGKKPPVARIKIVPLQVKVSTEMAMFVFIVSGFGIICSLCAILFNLRFGQLRLVKLSSPRLNNMIAVGCLLAFLYTILLHIEGQNWIETSFGKVGNCWTRVALLATGFTFSFGSLFAKTWRVHVIFTNKRLKHTIIKDWHLFGIVFVALFIDVVLFILWMTLDPMFTSTVNIGKQEVEEDAIIYEKYYSCCVSQNDGLFTIIFLCIKGVLLLFGIFFAWETRAVQIEELNDSKQIGVCVYNVMVMAGVAVPLKFLLQSNQLDLNMAILTICIIICQFTTLGLVFGSKMFLILKHGANAADDISSVMQNTSAIGEVKPNSASSKF